MVFQVSANDLDLGPNGKVKTNPHVYTQILVKSNDASLVEMNVFEFLLCIIFILLFIIQEVFFLAVQICTN